MSAADVVDVAMREQDPAHIFDTPAQCPQSWRDATGRRGGHAGVDDGRLTPVDEEAFVRQPYLATTSGRTQSIADIQLRERGIRPNTEMTTGFMLAFLTLRGTRMISLTQERPARSVMKQLGLRLLEAPMPLRPVVHTMIWTARNTDDLGHRWLRQRMSELARKLFANPPEGGRH